MAPSKERKGKKMKRLFLMTIAMLSMTMTFAENENANSLNNTEAYDMTVNMKKLAKALELTDEQAETVARLILNYFEL